MVEPPFWMNLYGRERVRPRNTFKNVFSALTSFADDDDNVDDDNRIDSVSRKISNEDMARFSCKINTFDTFFLNESMEFIQYSISCEMNEKVKQILNDRSINAK